MSTDNLLSDEERNNLYNSLTDEEKKQYWEIISEYFGFKNPEKIKTLEKAFKSGALKKLGENVTFEIKWPVE